MDEQKATKIESRILSDIAKRRTIRQGLKALVCEEDVSKILISETLDNFIEAKLESDKVLEGLLRDIKKEVKASGENIQIGLYNISDSQKS